MNTINTKVQELQQQKEALDARIAKLEELEDSTTPVKNLLVSLLADYATEALEELPIIWEEILGLGQQHGLSVQPLAVDELREWEATNAEHQTLKQEYEVTKRQYLELLEISAKQIKELQCELEKEKYNYSTLIVIDKQLNQELENLRSQYKTQLTEYQAAYNQPERQVWHKEEIAPELENLYQEALVETESEATAELTDEEYDAAVEEELALDDDEKDIPALTLWQPWATLIQQEVKRVETRSWGTNYRGPIAIHAAKKTVAAFDCPHLFKLVPYGCEFPFGAVVAIANLIDCVEMTPKFIAQQSETELMCGDWQAGRFAWILEIIRPVVPPIPVSGGQKLWNWSGTSIAAELEYLEKSKATLETAIYKEVSADSPEPKYEPEEASDTVESTSKQEDKEDKEEVTPEQTELQKLLASNSNFTFEELGVSVKIQSVFTEEEIESESDDPATEKVEEALIIACNAEGRHWRYYVNAQTFTHQCTIDSLEQAALGYAQHFLRDLEKQAKAKEEITQHSIEDAQQSEPAKPDTETEFEMMELKVRVYPQLPMGVTFRFLNPDNTLAFSNSLILAEIGDRTWKVCASDLIQNYRNKEAARIDKEQNPYKKPEDEFVEFVKISNAVGYLKRRDNGELIAGYAAFSNKLPNGHRAGTQAKSRAAKWAEWLKGTFELECDAPRIAKRMISDNSKQPFAYEIKLKELSIGQLIKLAEENLSSLPGEVEEQQQNTELLRSETKASPTPPGEIEQATEPINDGFTDEQYSKAVDKELASSTPASAVKSTFTGLTLGPECGLNEDELELVEMAKAAILECDSEMVKSVNSVFKEVCEKNAANRVKVWNALTEEQQQTYKLLLQMEFAKAPDFAEQTPEYIVTIDGGKPMTNVWISLREVDGKLARVWRYKGQKDEIGYATKESAAIAAISQQAG